LERVYSDFFVIAFAGQVHMNVLIIEDSLTTATILESFVTACGHHPICVPNAWLATPAALENPIDLVFMDIVLPGTDGYHLSARLRQQGVRVPIIAVTSHEDEPTKRRKYGIDGYMHKPVSMKQIKSLLEDYERVLRPAEPVPAPAGADAPGVTATSAVSGS
jgi:two-component system alkaline phosphatase synthesis response regulator PhoP